LFALAQREQPPLAIMDLGLPPDPDGVAESFATLEQFGRVAPETKVIVVTSHGKRVHALRAVAGGAYDFCNKPIEIEVLRMVVDRALRLHELEQENRQLCQASVPAPLRRIVTGSEAMLKIHRTIERVALTDVTVLLLGESGPGRQGAASARRARPQPARRGAIPETLLESKLFGHERGAFTGAVRQSIGKVESAHRGTLFLDEIGDLPLPLQVKLLRFLQEQTIERIGGRAPIPVDVQMPRNLDLRSARLRAECEVLQQALAYSDNRLSAAAKLLGISPSRASKAGSGTATGEMLMPSSVRTVLGLETANEIVSFLCP
jgi:two-component system NtrC family response regulator